MLSQAKPQPTKNRLYNVSVLRQWKGIDLIVVIDVIQIYDYTYIVFFQYDFFYGSFFY